MEKHVDEIRKQLEIQQMQYLLYIKNFPLALLFSEC